MSHTMRWLAIGFVGAFALGASAPAAAPPSPPASAVHEKRAEVFNRPEFKSGSPQDNSWLLRVLSQFFGWLNSLYDTARSLFWLLLISCVVLLALIVFHIVYTVRRA